MFKIEEKKLTIGLGRWKLPGVLTYPSRLNYPCPGAVLVHGSGPHDEDESIGPNKPFADLANGLASRGIAVLRYIKRTKQHPESVLEKNFTYNQETVEDAAAAVHALVGQDCVDLAKIFVVGHSLGATLAPRIAQFAPEVAGLILLAGMSRKLLDIMEFQYQYLKQVNPENAKAITKLEASVDAVRKAMAEGKTDGTYLGVPMSYWVDTMSYDPVATAVTVRKPMLILQGRRDYQVRTDIDFKAWKQGLKSREDVRFRSFQDLNHLFFKGEGTPGPAEYAIPSHVAPQVMREIGTFIKQVCCTHLPLS